MHPQAVVDLQQRDPSKQLFGHCDDSQVQLPLLHCKLLLQACVDPQPPQLLLSVSKLTQAPLQRV